MEDSKPFIFRVNENGNGPNLLMEVCFERGWQVHEGGSSSEWNLWWRTKGFPVSHYKNSSKNQYTNHVSKGFVICRKDNLIRHMKCMKKVYGNLVYDFTPEAYTLPQEYKKFLSVCKVYMLNSGANKNCDGTLDDDKVKIWICKPVSQSRGRGIFLFRSPYELTYNDSVIVQRYIQNPLLIGGYKFDLRLYVLVPSFHPLTIYVYREGLARFSTEKFSLNDLNNPFIHLTNTSLNKLGPRYRETKERIGSGCKWSLKHLRCYFQQTIISDWLLWQNITTLIVLTLASYITKVPPTLNCFEFYGFDVLIDATLKPWLIEVNSSPALCNDCDLDEDIKKPMLHDMFDLLELPLRNTGLSILSRRTRPPDSSKIKMKIPAETKKEASSSVLRFLNDDDNNNNSDNNDKPKHKNNHYYYKVKDNNNNNNNNNNNDKCSFVQNQKQRFRWKCSENKNDTWDNKINWKIPKTQEGNWVRIFPLLLRPYRDAIKPNMTSSSLSSLSGNNSSAYNTDEVKTIISSILNYSKIAKDVFFANENAADDEALQNLMAPYLLPDSKIWIPPI